MKLAWFCIPAHGHTNPTLGLVRELTTAGHEVFYFSFPQFQQKIEEAGATFIRCDEIDFEMEDKGNSDRVGKDIAFSIELIVSSTLALDKMLENRIAAIKPDLIVADSVAYWGKLAAMKYQIPFVSSTTTFAFNRFSARYMNRGFGELLKMLIALPKINKQIKRLQAHGYPVKSFLDIIQNDNDTNTIVYTSKYFQPCADTFSERYRFIGPSIRPITQPMKKTRDRTVYVSLGTVNRNPEFYRNCIHALSRTDWQIIVSMGNDTEEFENLPDNVELYPTVDQMAVLAIADAFITHCGMNSASEGLYFNVPLILCPQTSEQEAVARRVEELGAGVRLNTMAEDEILHTVETVLKNTSYREHARKISDSFKASGGQTEARLFLESLVSDPCEQRKSGSSDRSILE